MSLEALKEALKSEKITIGSKEVLRKLRLGEIKRVFFSSTCPQAVRETIKRYATQKKIEVVELTVPSAEVALMCKKNYPVSVLSC